MRRRRFLCAAATFPAWPQGNPGFQLAFRLEPELRILDMVPDGGDHPLVLAEGRQGGLLLRNANGEWLRESLPEPARSVASGHGGFWIAGTSGLWWRAVSGGKWERRWEGEGLHRVTFVGDNGFAVGEGKTILATADNGTWQRVRAADEPTTNTAYTTYDWIHFTTSRVGIISGASRPPRKGRTESYPAWLDTDPQTRRKEWPGASITLETRDGGLTWRHSVTSIFGKISRVRYARNGRGLALVEFHDAFDFPSEVFAIDLKKGSSERVFRRKDRAVTDTWIEAGYAFLASIEPPAPDAPDRTGNAFLYRSDDLQQWQEFALPLQAKGTRLWLAGTPDGAIWVALDTGLVYRSA
jgi:hypothetical protein